MIKKVEIRNYQSHENTKLEFHEGINVIIGETDSGKSAILRAMNWCINNRPSGDAFNRDGTNNIRVDMYLDGMIITKKKTKKYDNKYDNEYILSLPENTETYKAFGQDVPETIKNIFNISTINTQKQLEAPFLLSENGADAARILNKAAKLDKIDTVFSNINSKIRKNNTDINQINNRIIELKADLKKYRNLNEIEEKIVKLENVNKKLNNSIENHNNLGSIILNIETFNNNISAIRPIIEKSKKLKNKCNLIMDKIINIDKRYNTLSSIIHSILITVSNLDNNNNIIKNKNTLNDILKLYEEIESYKTREIGLEESVLKYEKLLKIISTNKKEVKKLKSEMKKISPKICPTCKQKWPK